jgi:hypothetical protein
VLAVEAACGSRSGPLRHRRAITAMSFDDRIVVILRQGEDITKN